MAAECGREAAASHLCHSYCRKLIQTYERREDEEEEGERTEREKWGTLVKI